MIFTEHVSRTLEHLNVEMTEVPVGLQLGLLADVGDIRGYALVLGIIGIATGLILLSAHKRSYDQALRTEKNRRLQRFERRKFRRRATVGSMVASAGCLLSALFWVTDAKIFSIFILLILSLLVGILGIAFFDMFSVGLQSLTRTNDAARQAMVKEYLRQRKKAAFKERDEG